MPYNWKYNQDRARYTLPGVVNPPKRRCIMVEVPDEIFHLAAFYGQIKALASAYSWGNDTAHTALLVAKVWREVFDNLRLCDVPVSQMGAGGEDDNLIRQSPDNPCLLQTSIDGTNWCTFADLSKCIPQIGQPGSGTPQPGAGGGQQCYNAQLDANGQWLLPYQVNTGDVITISGTSGAGTDGAGTWFCPNGQTYFLGGCAGSTVTNGADPMPAKPHMEIVAKIASTYYEANNTTITVPAGVTAANMLFQVNDGVLSDNYGSYQFKVCVTNNAAATWTHTFDFTHDDGGFAPIAVTVGVAGIYTGGTGWTNSDFQFPANNFYRGLIIKRTFAARTITSLQLTYDIASRGTNQGNGNNELNSYSQIAGALVAITYGNAANGTGQVASWNGSQAGATELNLSLWSSYYGAPATYQGSCALKKAVVSGLGTDPFV